MITKMHPTNPMHILSEAQHHQEVQISLRKANYDISEGRQSLHKKQLRVTSRFYDNMHTTLHLAPLHWRLLLRHLDPILKLLTQSESVCVSVLYIVSLYNKSQRLF